MARFLRLPIFLLFMLSGCAGLPITSQRETVILKTSSSTQYYSVRGTTTGAIFDDIEKNGLFDNEARRAVGVTAAEWSLDWRGIETRPALCDPEPLTITLKLVMTLPRHDHPNDLAPDTMTKWQRFAARVAAHEQRHVDIYLDGAKMMKTRMEAMLTKTSSCAELETTLRSVLASQMAHTERAQNEFHLEDAARIRNDQNPLRVQIELNQTRLTNINSEISGLDQTVDGLTRQRDKTHAAIDAVKAQMAQSGASLASCSQPRQTSGIQALCRQYNGLAGAYSTLLDQHNRTVFRRNNLVDE